jgi:hypothetical protein
MLTSDIYSKEFLDHMNWCYPPEEGFAFWNNQVRYSYNKEYVTKLSKPYFNALRLYYFQSLTENIVRYSVSDSVLMDVSYDLL